MILSVLMTVAMWLIKLAARGTVSAVALALKMVLKLIQSVPPEEYTKLIVTLESWLGMVVAKLGPAHPASQVLAGTPPQK